MVRVVGIKLLSVKAGLKQILEKGVTALQIQKI